MSGQDSERPAERFDEPPGERLNELGQPVGFPIGTWRPPAAPPRTALQGHWCRLEPLDPARHAEDLSRANAHDPEGRNWTYLAYGPFADLRGYRAWIERTCLGEDPRFYAICDPAVGHATGVASYLRIEPSVGCIEVGHINYSPMLQRRIAATEAMYLMMRQVFELGYRRYEWKCDSLNAPSRRAAQRLGFRFEGIFRQATVYKQRNRDTAWYSIIDREWPALDTAYRRWLDPTNFDADRRQHRSLGDLIQAGDSGSGSETAGSGPSEDS